ncbi:MAG: tRNA cyclic N6-threonylcarbamoyladenosine(37) synthase TcdA [Gammaproteobacteria bacterium]|nr:MAG: tRNA cyclic N6-threonylcarbamoyladenosine(37) synthase TcdA [Gammaproteobacteria bacterium]
MSDSAYQDRFGGIGRLYGQQALTVLKSAHVCVVGIGGVGSWAVEALARSGVGAITLIDMDDICVTNTNRQVHTQVNTIGELKVEAMAQRVRAINPECRVNPVMDFITRDNMPEYLTTDLDFVVDCIDSVASKAAMIGYCRRHKIKIITTGAAGGQLDPTQVTVGDLNKTFNDPLARKVRSMLRRHYGFSRNPKRTYSIPCVYSQEQLKYPKPDGSVCQQKSVMEGSTRLDCASGFGAATMVTATFGFAAASKVIEKLLSIAGVKS